MVSEDCELATKEIVTKLLYSVHQCQTFLLNDAVVAFQLCESPTGVCTNRVQQREKMLGEKILGNSGLELE